MYITVTTHNTGMDEATKYYFGFRYDFYADETASDVIRVIYDTAAQYSGSYGFSIKGILGEEHRNRYGDEIKRHLHFHFEFSSGILFNFREKVIYRIKKEFKHGRGRGWYSMIPNYDIRDMDRFYRYPLKQYEVRYDPTYDIQVPEEFDVQTQRIVANDEWERTKEIMCAKRDKNNSKDTTYERILALYHESGVKLPTRKAAFVFVMDFFEKEGFPPDRLKIRSILDGLCLKTGLLSMDDFYAGI